MQVTNFILTLRSANILIPVSIGGLGVIGGVGYTPKQLSEMITELKVRLKKSAMAGTEMLISKRSRF